MVNFTISVRYNAGTELPQTCRKAGILRYTTELQNPDLKFPLLACKPFLLKSSFLIDHIVLVPCDIFEFLRLPPGQSTLTISAFSERPNPKCARGSLAE
jgi:hypothetical protein